MEVTSYMWRYYGFLDLMLKCKIDSLSLDQIMDYEEVMKIMPDNIVLLGNLDPLELLYNSKPNKNKNRNNETFKEDEKS